MTTSNLARTRSRIFLTDRTSIETDWACGMRRWWRNEFGGTGIVPATAASALTEGADLHEWLARVAVTSDPREIVRALPPAPVGDQVALEVWCRLVGWVTAFALFVEPRLREDYDTVQVEGELVYQADPLWIACTPDRVLRRKRAPEAGKLVYLEYKSTGAFNTASWCEYWPHAVQLHTGLAALAQEHGPDAIAWAQVQGFTKGTWREGKLRHPYTYAYTNGSDWTAAWTRGWDLASVSEYPGGPAAWAEHLGAGMAAEVLPLTRAVFLDERIVARVVAERTERERLVAAVRDQAATDPDFRARVFPMNLAACRPMIGAPCAYQACCWNASVEADPLASGAFVPRVPHHDIEGVVKAARREEGADV